MRAAVLLALVMLAGGCGARNHSPAQAADAIAVSANDTTCTVATSTLPAGTHVFRVVNGGAKVTEFYVYGPGDRIVGEVENITPGLSRDLRVTLNAGQYQASCRPGMSGTGIRKTLTVTGTAAAPATDPLLVAATAGYQTYVRAQADDLLRRTRAWIGVVKSGDLATARDGFAATRAPFERIEPVAESFAVLDARIDARDTDLGSGAAWTGFHRLEKDLWQNRRPAPALADGLLADVTALRRQLSTQTFTALDLANGAKSLLDEVAARRITSRTPTCPPSRPMWTARRPPPTRCGPRSIGTTRRSARSSTPASPPSPPCCPGTRLAAADT